MYPQHIQEAAAAMGRTLTESATPLYGSGLRLPDRRAVIDLVKEVRRLLLAEGLLLCAVTAAFGGVLSDLSLFLGDLAGISLHLSVWQTLGAITLSALVTLGLHVGASFRLVYTEPAIALRT